MIRYRKAFERKYGRKVWVVFLSIFLGLILICFFYIFVLRTNNDLSPPAVVTNAIRKEDLHIFLLHRNELKENVLKPESRVVDLTQPLPKILCIVKKTTINQREPDGVKAIRETWGPYCTKTMFIDTEDHPYKTQGDDVLQRPDGIKYAAEMFIWTLREYASEFEWVLQVEDVTYVFTPQLYQYVSTLDASNSLFLGCRLQLPNSNGFVFNSGGAGFLLSKPSIDALKESTADCVKGNWRDLDLGIANCLREAGILASDSREVLQLKERFNVFEPLTYSGVGGIWPLHTLDWFHNYRKFYTEPQVEGSEFISGKSVTMHYIKTDEMRALHEYLIQESSILPAYFDRFRQKGESFHELTIIMESLRNGYERCLQKLTSLAKKTAKGHMRQDS